MTGVGPAAHECHSERSEESPHPCSTAFCMTELGPTLPAALQCHPRCSDASAARFFAALRMTGMGPRLCLCYAKPLREILRCAQNDRGGAFLTKRTPKILGSFCGITPSGVASL